MQELAEPKTSLLQKMGEQSRKPLKALVKSLKKDH